MFLPKKQTLLNRSKVKEEKKRFIFSFHFFCKSLIKKFSLLGKYLNTFKVEHRRITSCPNIKE